MNLDKNSERSGLIELEISASSSNGDGISRLPDGRVCFVAGALPGESVRARFVRQKKDYATLKTVRILRQAPERVTPRCPWFADCGGCQLQHMGEAAQLEFKRKAVAEALARQGSFRQLAVPVESCRPSPVNWGYRNKAAFPVGPSKKGAVTGFYQEGSHWIVPIDRCPILDPELEKGYQIARGLLKGLPLEPYDERGHRGRLRHMIFRKGAFSGEGMMILVLTEMPARRELKKIRAFFARVSASCPSITNGVLNINSVTGNFIWGPRNFPVAGKAFFHETLEPFSFRLDPSAFFQINSRQAVNLYHHVAQEASSAGGTDCLELFSGTGSLTAFLAPFFDRMTAVESWQDSVKGLRHNLRENGIRHVQVRPEKAESFVAGCQPGSFQIVVLDPPRSGCRPEVIEGIRRIGPRRIVYVSCNPATLARDLKSLAGDGLFRISRIIPFDMFPQTHHVETVVTLDAVS